MEESNYPGRLALLLKEDKFSLSKFWIQGKSFAFLPKFLKKKTRYEFGLFNNFLSKKIWH